MKIGRLLSIAALALGMGACAQMCAPDAVGTGIARLTMRNVGAIASLVAADTSCGFANVDVLAGASVDGAIGGEGTVTWTVTDCALDLGDKTLVGEDCKGVKTEASGKVTVSATKTVAGVLTGVAENPVVPGGPDAATITITEASFDNFAVTKSSSDSSLTMISGSIAATMKPRLAVAADTGACAITTSHAAFSGVVYKDASVELKSPELTEVIPVATSDLSAQNGVGGDKENAISGSITVWDAARDVPAEGDSDGLDPDYEAQAFVDSFACNPDLAQPVSFACVDLTPRLADGAARLSAKMLAAVAGAVSADTSCGFSAPSVAGAPSTTGSAGDHADVVFTVSSCPLSFDNVTLAADCNGAASVLDGEVTVSGTKTIHGFVTGNPMQPVIPDRDDAAVVELSLSFNNLKVSSSSDANALLAKSGSLSGSVQPRLAVGSQGACDIQSSIARLSDLTWTDGELAVSSVSGTFDLSVEDSGFDGTAGTWDTDSNLLSGTVTINGSDYTVPSDGLGLDPSFDQATHDASWQCAPGLVTPVSHVCGMQGPLAQGSARLGAKLLATVTALVDADTTCGFSSMAVGGTPSFNGSTGDRGDATFTVSGCTLDFRDQTALTPDCTGAFAQVQGQVTVSGTKKVSGWLTGNPMTPVVPTSDKPAVFDLQLDFSDFELTADASGTGIHVVSGGLDGQLEPRTAMDASTNACSITTPYARFSGLAFDNAELILRSDGNSLGFSAEASAVNAVNGAWGNDTNTLAGTVTIGGAPVPVPVDGAGLNPDFDVDVFDDAFSCNPALGTPHFAACSFNTPLGQGAARLIIKAVGVATSMLDKNDVCGFSAVSMATNNTVSGTPPGSGSITWSTAGSPCRVHVPVDMAIATDCSGTETHVKGTFVANTSKSVSGFLTGSNPPILPLDRDAASFVHNSLVFEDFMVYDLPAGATDPAAHIVLNGAVTGTVKPIAGATLGASDPVTHQPIYGVSTPVAEFVDIAMSSGTATLVSEGKTFKLDLALVSLDAFNGSYGGQSNSISGTLNVMTEAVTLPDPRLNPDFDQAAFDASYACTPGLTEPVPSD